MIVCHCRALSDRAIRDVIRRGANSPSELIACHAGRRRRCGGCVPVLRELIASETSRASECVELPVAAAS